MANKKFTDDEIIKRLERCVNRGNRNYDTDIVLDLINRQKSEIERLKECPKCVYEYDGEVTEYCVQGPCPNFKTVEQIKAEAYNEFAEWLKKLVRQNDYLLSDKYNSLDRGMFTIGFEQAIDNLLKEMVGEE